MNHRFMVVAFLILSCRLFSQEIRDPLIKTYGEDHGLANNTVFRMEMDNFGFLWIITWDGLSRFDGYQFKNYYHDPNDSTSIPYFTPNEICIDRSNNIWVFSGILSRYDREIDRFVPYRPGSKSHIPSEEVYSVTKDNDGNLLVLGSGGILKYNDRSGGFDKIQIENTGYKDLINKDSRLMIDDRGDFWICDLTKYILYFGKGRKGPKKSTRVNFTESFRFPINTVKSGNFSMEFKIYALPYGNYLIASNVGLYFLDKINLKIKLIRKPEIQIFNGLNKNVVWSSIDEGLYHYEGTVKKVKHFPVRLTGAVTNFFLDKQDILWFGSFRESAVASGLNQIKPRVHPWKYYPVIENKQRKKLSVYAICEDYEGKLWVGTKNSLDILVLDRSDKHTKIAMPLTKGFNSQSTPRTILCDSKKSIWVGTLDGYLFRLNPGEKKFNRIYPARNGSKDKLPIHSIKILKNISSDHLLATGFSGSIIINNNSLVPEKFIKNAPGDIYSVFIAKDGHIWTGNVGQLNCFDPQFNPEKRITIAGGGYNIEDIVSIDDSVLWLTLLGGGLCSYNKTTGEQKIFTKRQGLSNNVVYSILKDKNSNLWMSTNDGLSMCNTMTGQFVNYGEEDDLEIKEFNSDAALLKKDGMLLFGGIGGIVGFYPDSLQKGSAGNPSRLIINELKCSENGHSYALPVFDKKKMSLPRGIRSITINFSEINFSDQSKSNFGYRILGLNDTWNPLPKGTRTMEISGFKPGTYTVEIAGTDNSGAWSKLIPLRIDIPPYYYETWLFRGSIVVIVVTILTLFVVYRFRHISLIHKQRLTHLKQLMLLQQLNPHFISNSLMAVEELSSQGNELKTNEYIARLYSLFRKMMNYRGKEFVSIFDEVVLIEDFLKAEQMRIGFDYTFQYWPGQDQVLIAPSFIQPLIENAIKHGLALRDPAERKLIIKIHCYNQGSVVCTVEDNGIGFNRAAFEDKLQSGKSKGWRIMIERLIIYQTLFKKKYAYEIIPVDSSSEFPGTRIKIEIPAKIEMI